MLSGCGGVGSQRRNGLLYIRVVSEVLILDCQIGPITMQPRQRDDLPIRPGSQGISGHQSTKTQSAKATQGGNVAIAVTAAPDDRKNVRK
jgi:hypothetical protein